MLEGELRTSHAAGTKTGMFRAARHFAKHADFRERGLEAKKMKAAGGGAGRRGHGVMEVQTLSRPESRGGSATPSLEHSAILGSQADEVDRPPGSIRIGTKVPRTIEPAPPGGRG